MRNVMRQVLQATLRTNIRHVLPARMPIPAAGASCQCPERCKPTLSVQRCSVKIVALTGATSQAERYSHHSVLTCSVCTCRAVLWRTQVELLCGGQDHAGPGARVRQAQGHAQGGC